MNITGRPIYQKTPQPESTGLRRVARGKRSSSAAPKARRALLTQMKLRAKGLIGET